MKSSKTKLDEKIAKRKRDIFILQSGIINKDVLREVEEIRYTLYCDQ